MASLGFLGLGAGMAARTVATRASKGGSGGGQEEKGPFDWLVNALQKEDQLLETDPVLNKVEGKGTTSARKSTTSVTVPANGNGKKKLPGLGGLFAKN